MATTYTAMLRGLCKFDSEVLHNALETFNMLECFCYNNAPCNNRTRLHFFAIYLFVMILLRTRPQLEVN